MPEEQENLCTRALLTMDTMLQVMMLNTPGAKRSEMMQDMLEVLLEYLLSDRAEVQERAIDRIKALCHMLTATAPKEDDEDEDEEEAPRAQIQMPVLGKLLGNLFFMLFKPNESMSTVVEILSTLMAFLSEQKSDNPESYVQPPEDWEPEITSWVNASNAWKVEAFGRYLGPDERMGVVLEAIEILGRFDITNKDGPVAFLEEVKNTPEMWLMDAKKMKSLLPEMTALDTFHNVLGQLKKKEASSMALKAVERLWKLFDAREECLRERSISLFKELLGKTIRKDKEAMKRNSWKVMVQLVLHISDEAPSVAKASKEAVVAIAELFKWKEFKELAQKEEIWKMSEFLLAKDSSRAEQYVLESQPYLLSPQASMREAALRFLGLAARRLAGRNEATMDALLTELGLMETREKDPSIAALAAQTGLILTALKDRRKSGLSLRGLCRWCR
ncbi:uncharacterized protein LOC135441746 [Zonotrichia leucophrys gambelii]|uniref:uncharacterized protein LOC135441746 n=1 Tax=Zonotrichia leucophrys gambelii TaxID=257770 RepID=UPI0031402AA3